VCLTVELEAVVAGPVAVDRAIPATASGPPPGRRPAAAGHRRRRAGAGAAEPVRVVPCSRRQGRIPALEGRLEQPLHLAAALGGWEVERLRVVAPHEAWFVGEEMGGKTGTAERCRVYLYRQKERDALGTEARKGGCLLFQLVTHIINKPDWLHWLPNSFF
jgi:hypothetical protein